MNITEAIEAAVAERGADYVYPQNKDDENWWSGGACRYVTQDGQPACIVGLALTKMGVPAKSLDVIASVKDLYDPDIGYDLTNLPNLPNLEPEEVEALWNAQDVQDGGGTWGEALAAYKAVLS